MTFDLIAFIILALVCVLAALGMLLSKNTVYSALFLILNFVTIALFYLLLGAPFLAMIQVTVYAGAIMVLFLFVIMLLGTETLQEDRALKVAAACGDHLGSGTVARNGLYILCKQRTECKDHHGIQDIIGICR